MGHCCLSLSRRGYCSIPCSIFSPWLFLLCHEIKLVIVKGGVHSVHCQNTCLLDDVNMRLPYLIIKKEQLSTRTLFSSFTFNSCLKYLISLWIFWRLFSAVRFILNTLVKIWLLLSPERSIKSSTNNITSHPHSQDISKLCLWQEDHSLLRLVK